MLFPLALAGSVVTPDYPLSAEFSISIIIPTYNEAVAIAALLDYLRRATAGEPAPELLVVDGGSTDATVRLARQAGATVRLSPHKGRAA